MILKFIYIVEVCKQEGLASLVRDPAWQNPPLRGKIHPFAAHHFTFAIISELFMQFSLVFSQL